MITLPNHPRPLARALCRAALSACAAVTAGCAPPPAPEPPQPIQDWHALVGCYQAGDWLFALDSVPALAYYANPPAGALQAWNYSRERGDIYWTFTPEGDARVVEHNGMDGSTTRWRARGDRLIGTHVWWTDIVMRPRAPDRIVAVKTACPGPSAEGDPPPHPGQLERTAYRGVADMLVDSVVPRYRLPMLPARPGASRFTGVVSSIVSSHGSTGHDSTYGMRLEVESDSLTRNEAVATVAITVCKDQPEPMNLQVERFRYRFLRAPGGWRLVETEPLGRTAGECGSHLSPTPQP